MESQPSVSSSDIVVTGDRPTGPLHLGHYAGSLTTRLRLQHLCRQYILIADLQALTDNAGAPARVADHVLEVALDYLAVGIEPGRSTIALQSAIPELAELTILLLNLVTVARLERNPTIRDEIRQRGFARDIPAGFLMYPVSQAADIAGFRATVVPVGADQLPMIEQSNELVRALNRLAEREVLVEARPLLSATQRLPGLDGKSKMSKSLGNVINLTASPEELRDRVKRMYTDPGHLRVEDPGQIEGNTVFAYLDAFDPDAEEVAALKQRYRRGGLADSVVKQRLATLLEALLAPIRARRAELASRRHQVADIVDAGTQVARAAVAQVLGDVREAFKLRREVRGAG
ncbi:MAG: tryptophan--tRNA ligase [Deltaproteobacteria bacterium]|nr:tryptophan--tRNA ligase [Deltaproteobacteria bacterium]